MKPILFNTDMVRAILDNRKTVTRRVVKPQPEARLVPGEKDCYIYRGIPYGLDGMTNFAPYRPGDILYVREAWRVQSARRFDSDARIEFKSGGDMVRIQFPGGGDQYHSRTQYDRFVSRWADDKWHPSIHMPREAARIFLRVTDVRVERLQDITEEQAKKEAAEPAFEYSTPEGPVIVFDENGYYDLGFKALWDSTIKPAGRAIYGWAANPWVWVIEFERISKQEAGSWKK